LKVAIGSDHAGYKLKQLLVAHLREAGHDVVDVGTDSEDSVDYPDFVGPVAHMTSEGEVDRGIVVCSTGIGSSMAANKVRGVRCALCHTEYEAKYSRLHNDANVLALGQNVTGPALALAITDMWLATEFSQEERHARRIGKISALESDN